MSGDASASASAAASSNGVTSPSPAVAAQPADDGFFAAPRFQSLEWRLDIARHSSTVSDSVVPSAIVQIRSKPGDQPEQLLTFEVGRDQAANVLLEFERIDAIMASAH
jgi:hypothetical protein